MEASDLLIEPSPVDPAATRASIRVSYDYRGRRPERWWFELPNRLTDDILPTGDAWLAALLPLAWTLGEALVIGLTVSDRLLGGAHQIMQIWSQWYPRFRPIPISAESHPARTEHRGSRTVCFSSGGIDSTYTALHHDHHSDAPIDELAFIRGFDLRLGNEGALREAERRMAHIAAAIGKQLIFLSTNLRDTRLREANWERIAHAPVLAAAGLLLGRRYRRVLVGSAWPVDLDHPFGSHPEIFNRFSTASTQMEIYAADTKRAAKVVYLRDNRGALDHLRVCWEDRSGSNCGRCAKCLGAMIALDIYGLLEGCAAFPTDELDHRRIRGLYLGRKSYYFEELHEHAAERGRADIVASLEAAFQATEALNRWLLLDKLVPLFRQWRIHPRLRRLTHAIRPLAWRTLRGLLRLLTTGSPK